VCYFLQNHKNTTFYALKLLKPANQRFKVNLQQIYYMSIPGSKNLINLLIQPKGSHYLHNKSRPTCTPRQKKQTLQTANYMHMHIYTTFLMAMVAWQFFFDFLYHTFLLMLRLSTGAGCTSGYSGCGCACKTLCL